MALLFENINFDRDFISDLRQIMSYGTGNHLSYLSEEFIKRKIYERMRFLGFTTSEEYVNFYKKNKAAEKETLISHLTTHYTYFFRDHDQILHLLTLLPNLVASIKSKGKNKIRIWSAACSTGEEVYSIAMFLKFHLAEIDSKIDFEIVGTDIDKKCIQFAKNGVYRKDKLAKVALAYQVGCWQAGKDHLVDFVRIHPELKAKCIFANGNLTTLPEKSKAEPFDLILIRNVLLYFDEETSKDVINKVLKRLEPYGYLLTGVAEALDADAFGLVNLKKNIYQTKQGNEQENNVNGKISNKSIIKKQPIRDILRVITVDDSSTIQQMLKLILKEENGFELVAQAGNGIEARNVLLKHEADIMTLDIHMPEMNGIEYLKKYYDETHPPVVILSSVSRETSDLAIEALRSGAIDFVEKPTAKNYSELTHEILSKLKIAYLNSKRRKDYSAFVDTINQKKPSEQKYLEHLAIIFYHFGDLERAIFMSKERDKPFPPTVYFFDCTSKIFPSIIESFEKSGVPCSMYEEGLRLEKNNLYLGQWPDQKRSLERFVIKKHCAVGVVGVASSEVVDFARDNKSIYLVAEDHEQQNPEILEIAADVIPTTSFVYLLKNYLSYK